MRLGPPCHYQILKFWYVLKQKFNFFESLKIILWMANMARCYDKLLLEMLNWTLKLKNSVRQIFPFVNNHRVWLYNVSKQKVMGF
jgi:hypothetical protein